MYLSLSIHRCTSICLSYVYTYDIPIYISHAFFSLCTHTYIHMSIICVYIQTYAYKHTVSCIGLFCKTCCVCVSFSLSTQMHIHMCIIWISIQTYAYRHIVSFIGLFCNKFYVCMHTNIGMLTHICSICVVIPHKCTHANTYCLCGYVQYVCTHTLCVCVHRGHPHFYLYTYAYTYTYRDTSSHTSIRIKTDSVSKSNMCSVEIRILYVNTYRIRIVYVGVYREAHPPTPSIYIIYM